MVDSLQLAPELARAASQELHIFRERSARKDEGCVSRQTVTHLDLYILETDLPGPTDGRQ